MSTSPNNQSTGNTKPPSKRAENTPTPSEFLGIIFNWLRHWWDAPHEKSKPADWAMVGLTIIIAVTAFWSICVFEGQLKEARRATDLSEKQWHLDHMPWLAIENNTLGIRPKPIASNNNFAVDVFYSVKDFGNTPAFNETDYAQAFSPEMFPPQNRFNLIFCRSSLGEPKSRPVDIASLGQVILPTMTAPIRHQRVPVFTTKNHLQGILLTVCILYQDSSGTFRHTRYVFRTQHGEKPIDVPIEGQPGLTYWPITGTDLENEQAD